MHLNRWRCFTSWMSWPYKGMWITALECILVSMFGDFGWEMIWVAQTCSNSWWWRCKREAVIKSVGVVEISSCVVDWINSLRYTLWNERSPSREGNSSLGTTRSSCKTLFHFSWNKLLSNISYFLFLRYIFLKNFAAIWISRYGVNQRMTNKIYIVSQINDKYYNV